MDVAFGLCPLLPACHLDVREPPVFCTLGEEGDRATVLSAGGGGVGGTCWNWVFKRLAVALSLRP